MNKYISVSIVDDSEIKKLNKKYRGKDEVTDVLSFEMGEEREEGFYVGDVIVNEELAKKQAAEFGNSIEEEIAELIEHGILHLLGVHHKGDT